jgi:anti-anti-sigma regulatory factor
MLKIQRSLNEGVVLSLSGRIEADDVAELQRLLRLEAAGQEIAFDLRDVILVDRDAVTFLARCEAERVKLENCPAYIREWIDQGKDRTSRADSEWV